MQRVLTKGNATYLAVFVIAILAIIYFFSSNSAQAPAENIVPDVDEVVAQDTNMTTNPIVVFTTNFGDIELELFEEKSPITAGNFKKLVEEGYYDGVKFHRVIANFMIQAGDPLSKDDANKQRWGTGGPGYAIEDEFIEGLSNVRGTIAMANAGPNTGGSQFFINLVDNVNLDWDKQPAQSKHPVFGKVMSGMDVVDEIGGVATQGIGNTPVKDVVIEKAIIK